MIIEGPLGTGNGAGHTGMDSEDVTLKSTARPLVEQGSQKFPSPGSRTPGD